MNVALRKPMTLEEFLEWEERQERKFEFNGFAPVAMPGGTSAHAAIQRNLLYALTGRLRGKPCQSYGSELKIQVAGHIRYPDAFVVCTPIPLEATVVPDPVVVFEILSESSIHTDLIEKKFEYNATPSIRDYVIVQQTHRGATAFTRKGSDWLAVTIREGGTLSFPAIGLEIPLAELYIDVDVALDSQPELA